MTKEDLNQFIEERKIEIERGIKEANEAYNRDDNTNGQEWLFNTDNKFKKTLNIVEVFHVEDLKKSFKTEIEVHFSGYSIYVKNDKDVIKELDRIKSMDGKINSISIFNVNLETISDLYIIKSFEIRALIHDIIPVTMDNLSGILKEDVQEWISDKIIQDTQLYPYNLNCNMIEKFRDGELDFEQLKDLSKDCEVEYHEQI